MAAGHHTFHFDGIGVHTGKSSHIIVETDPKRHQVTFETSEGTVAAVPGNLSNRSIRSTDITQHGVTIQTVEHLLFALSLFTQGARVIVDGPEIPIMDGSALPFVTAFKQQLPIKKNEFFNVTQPFEMTSKQSVARVIPCVEKEKPIYTVQLAYDEPEMGNTTYAYTPNVTNAILELVPARTFALESEVHALRQQNKGLGGSLKNALVIGENGPLNPGGMRFSDEPARHKMLDIIGDFSLMGALPFAHLHILRPGHTMNHSLAHALHTQRQEQHANTNNNSYY